MMRYLTAFLILMAVAPELEAQEFHVAFSIDPTKDTMTVSPYLAGSNGQTGTFQSRRAGGNRWTGYNWETNASNAGTDYLNESDNYMSYQLPVGAQHEPGSVPLRFFLDSRAQNAYSLITLPAAGYVAGDESGPVSASETAPSSRWKRVVFQKDGPLLSTPDTIDGAVFVDEEINSFVQSLGPSTLGQHGYACDNEPALWPSTHPRIHPAKTTCAEVIAKDSAIGAAVRRADPSAEVFGPVAYGYNEFLTNQDAPDWNNYKSYGHWIDAYLAKMQDVEKSTGKRLLDVLDVHWYPEAQGVNWIGALERIAQDTSTSPGVRRARMDAPRSLWDSSYKENSWIGQYFSPVALLPWLKASIAKNYPGTKLAFTEFNYGGENDVSGTIAVADVLGIFGKYGVYLSNYWGNISSTIMPAYDLYSKIGDRSILATTSNYDSTSIYARIRSKDPNTMDVILINKSTDTKVYADVTIDPSFVVDSLFEDLVTPHPGRNNSKYKIGSAFYKAELAPLSVSHHILHRASVNAVEDHAHASTNIQWFSDRLQIESGVRGSMNLVVYDLLGRNIVNKQIEVGSDLTTVQLPRLIAGSYFAMLRQGPNIVAAHNIISTRQ